MRPDECRYVATETGYSFDPAKAVQTGRRRELVRTLGVAIGLLVAQVPMRAVATGRLESAFTFPALVPGRLALVLDTLMVVAYLLVSYRANGLVHALRAPRRTVRANSAGMTLVALGAALDLAENAVLWRSLGDPGRAPSMTVPWLTPLSLLLVLVGLTLQAGTVLAQRRTAEQRVREALPPAHLPETRGTVICCSGGGIRSSAFSLGGLQTLTEAGIYPEASAVVGVSGGGYVAAAYHVLRWQPDDVAEPGQSRATEWPAAQAPAAFALDSPELAWVRRHTRYLVDSLKVAAQGALSLAFGIGVNLLLVTAALGGAAWMLAWLLLASGRLQPWPVGDHLPPGEPRPAATISGTFADGWPWQLVERVWLVPVAGLACFVLMKVLDKLMPGPSRVQGWLGMTSTRLLVGGGAATAVLLGVPWVLDGLTAFAASSDSAAAGLVHQLGLVPTQVCNDVLSTGASACGVRGAPEVAGASARAVSAVSVATVVSSILAVMASAKSAVGTRSASAGWLGRMTATVWAKVKDPVVPWGAVVLIVAVMALVLLRWVAAFVADPDLFLRWGAIYLFVVLLVAAKVLTEPNRTSLHHFFRERISKAFLVRRNSVGGVEAVPYRRPLRFSEASPRDEGPALVACAIANVSDQELVPSRRGCTPFVFDHDRIGLTDPLLPPAAAQRVSSGYEFAADVFYRDATVPAAVAISAAAFSPLAGRENVRLGPYRAVLALGNARLGVWLPNPLWLDEARLVRRLIRLGKWVEAAALVDTLGEDEVRGLRPADRAGVEHARTARALLAADAAVASALAGTGRAEGALTAAANALDAPPPATLRDARARVRAALAGLPEPGRSARMWQVAELCRNIAKKPGLSKLVKEAVGRPSVHDRFLYVTDGGHYDNLGIVEALRRRPRRVFVLDASNDAEDTFRTLGRAIATARMDLGLEVEMDPRGMRRIADERSAAAWCAGTYREAGTVGGPVLGHVYLVKAIMLDGLPWDIETYSGDNLEFPRTSTGRQLYSEFDFEAYRMLGQVTAQAMLAATQGGTTLGERSRPHAVEPADEDAA